VLDRSRSGILIR